MNWIRKLRLRWRALFFRKEIDARMDDEIHSHIEMQVQENIAAGMRAEEARYTALRQFGWVESVKEACRDQLGVNWIENVLQDLRFGLRMMQKHIGFSAVAILTLALGIGASTTMFSVLHAVLLRPLPYAKPEALIEITETHLKRATPRQAAPVNFLYWERMNTVFSGIAGFGGGSTDSKGKATYDMFVTGIGEALRLKGLMVTPNLFTVLGVDPMLGRNFSDEEFYDGSDPVAILSYRCWQTEFGADPNIIGRAISLNRLTRKVIGVMPPGFFFLSKEIQVFYPPGVTRSWFEQETSPWMRVIARLRPGVSIGQAKSEMAVMAGQLESMYPGTNKDIGVRLQDFHSVLTASRRSALLLLFLAVEVLFLIVCSNLANLQLSRAASRTREFSIRNALGASRTRLIGQLLTESLLLSVLGGLLGFLAAAAARVTLLRLAPDVIPQFAELKVDSRVVLFNAAITMLAPILFGIIPALSASQPDRLRERGESHSRSNRFVRDMLVSIEVALSVVLLVGAGLLCHSFLRLERADPGFRPDHSVSFRLLLPDPPYTHDEQARAFTDIDNRLRSLPGVEAVGASVSVPLRGEQGSIQVAAVEDRGDECDVRLGMVTRDYFRAMGTPLLRGRFFNDSDRATSLPVSIVNQAFEKAYFGGESALSKRFKYGHRADTNYSWITIVGVIADQKQDGIELSVQPTAYAPLTQITPMTVAFVLRGPGDPKALVAGARRAIQSAYKDLALYDIATLDEVVHGSIGEQRFRTSLLSGFASIALLLAALGVYGVLAFSVAQRSIEIGIRLALGAQRSNVQWLVLRQGFKPAGIGMVIGLAGALAFSRLLHGLLYGVDPADPATFFIVSVLITMVAALACWLPARRAARVDPMVALRCQ